MRKQAWHLIQSLRWQGGLEAGGQVQGPLYSYTPAPDNPPFHAGTGRSFFQGASTAPALC